MKILTRFFDLSTQGNNDVIDITEHIRQHLKETLLEEGNVTIFNPGSTAGITTIEYEPGLIVDIKKFFENLVPKENSYDHDKRWHDGNGYSHIRSSLVKPSLVVPFFRSELLLGTWQQIVFFEFDNRPRNRRVVTQFIGT
jgi:secondary thiamine-phosphate synthase enzyme